MPTPRLHPRTIEAVKERADIVDVVGEHVVLRKRGREFVGLCPFHEDSSPSMTVSPAKQFYYCFACGAGGNAIKFLMELQRHSFSDVVLDLARRYQLPVETLDAPQQERLRQQLSRRDLLHRVLSLAAGWFRDQLLQSPAAADAVAGIPKRLAKLWPWNEFLQLELNHKTLHVPCSSTSPNQLPTLRILHLSDLHFTGTPGLEFYRRVVELALQQPTDAVMFTGDLIDDPQLLPAAVEILKPLTQIAPCWFVLGNHDWRYNHELIRQTLEDSGWQSAAGRQIPAQIRGLNLLIAGSERPWMSTPPQDAHHTPADLRILLCHTPDGLANARKLGYQIVLAGHTHGGQVVLPVIGPVYSPSSHGVKFASGLFQFPDSTLHVSRGVGSKDPLRWNCTPELTWLHVQPAHHTQPRSPNAD